MFGVQLGRDGADDITEGGMRISFSDGLALAGIALSIVLLVLDKAGKLKPGPILFLLLILAFLMTIPLALGNSWVSAAHSGLARIPRTLLALCLFGALFSSLAVYVSGAQNEEGRTAESAADERIQLSLTCDTVNLPMPYSGDLWILDTIFLKGLMKSSANPLHPAGFWPEQGVWGTGFRCVLKNYGTGPAFGVTLSLEAVKREIVRGKDPTGWHSGNVLSNHNPIVMVPQPLVQQGQEPFTFYVCSYDPDHLIEITLPTSAFINTDDPSQKATVPLRITSTLGNPLPIMPTRRQDSK
jgi:hypothetical protein